MSERIDLPCALFAARSMVKDTFAQARAAGISWGLLAVTAVCALFCLGVSVVGDTPVLDTRNYEDAYRLTANEAARLKLGPDAARREGIDVATGELKLLFGAVAVPLTRTRTEAVRTIQAVLGGGVADTAGVLLCLLWTAGFLPSFLDSTSATVLLAKPTPRWAVLAGKCAGVVAFVVVQAFLFVGATWLALAVRTDVWDLRYFLAVPVLLLHFGMFFGISTFVAVRTRSAVASALVVLVCWAVCFSVNVARHDAVARDGHATQTLESCYWLLPKPADHNLLLAESLGVSEYFRLAVDVKGLNAHGGFQPELSLLTGLLLPVGALCIAGRSLAKADY